MDHIGQDNKQKPGRLPAKKKGKHAAQLLIWLAVLIPVFLLAGCAAADEKNTETAVTETQTEVLPSDTGLHTDGAETLPLPGDGDQNSLRVQLGDEGPADYEQILWDRSDRTLNKRNQQNALVQCYYPVLSGAGAVEHINGDIYRVAEAFVNAYTEEEIRQPHYAYDMAFPYTHKGFININHNGNGLISVCLTYNGFWGEGQEYSGAKGYVYSLSTGERLTLSQLTGLAEADLLPQVKDCIEKKYRHTGIEEEIRQLLETITMEDIGFIVSEGQICLLIEKPFSEYQHGGSRPVETEWTIF